MAYPFTYPSLSALDGVWSDPSKQDNLADFHDSQTSEEVASLFSSRALLYQLTQIFRPIPLVSIHPYSQVLFRKSTEAGQHTLKKATHRYESSFDLLEPLFLSQRFESRPWGYLLASSHISVIFAANDIHSGKVFRDIDERHIDAPIRVFICVANSNGLALVIIGLTLRCAILMSILTRY